MNVNSDKFDIVLQKEDTLNSKSMKVEDIKQILDDDDSIIFYAFILHDKDTDENGQLKTPHYHLFLQTRKPYSKNTVLGGLVKSLGCNRDIVGVRLIFENPVKVLRYLVHYDDENKYQYDEFAVCTNDYGVIFDALNKGVYEKIVDIPLIACLCKESKYITDVYDKLGIVSALKYQRLIRDVWNDVHYGANVLTNKKKKERS